MSDCVVCMGASARQLAPCMHFICPSCAEKWLNINPTCPVCRGILEGYRAPFEGGHRGGMEMAIDFGPYDHAGVTLDHGVSVGKVVITRLQRRDRFYQMGLRVGDSIESVNGVRTTTADTAIQLLENSRVGSGQVNLEVGQTSTLWRRRSILIWRLSGRS